MYTDYTAPSPTGLRKKLTNPLCGGCVLVSVVVAVLAAAACDSVVTTGVCCHSLPFSVPDHHHAASLLIFFGQRCRDCFCYVVTDAFSALFM